MSNEYSPDFIQKLLDKIDSLTIAVSELTAANQKLSEIIVKQQEEISQLKEQLNKNSKNSSKPPSSDGLQKTSPKSLRKPSGKKQGGQKGHEGKGFSIIKSPDESVDYAPTKCLGCLSQGKCVSCGVTDTRYEVDIVVETKVIRHRSLSFVCEKTGTVLSGTFPDNITATMQYGNNLKALAISLNIIGMVSVNRTHKILSAVFDIPICTGTIHSMVLSCAGMIIDTVDRIRLACANSELCHFDETGSRVAKKTMWFHDASNKLYTYLTVSEKRGQIGMDECNVLPHFKGIAVHDCWKSYWKYSSIQHAVCCAHLLRELTGIFENYPEQPWAKQMIELLLRMKKVRDKAADSGKECLSYYHLHGFNLEYNRIIAAARILNPIKVKELKKRGRQAKGKVRALVERLFEYKESICLFTKNFIVPFDNNQAERDIRMVKVKTKVSGCFRTKDGADAFAKIMSYIGTANKHGINSFVAIRQSLMGQSDFVLD